MPITQSRMIALINAASDFEEALFQSCRLVRTERQLFKTGNKSAEEALEIIAATLDEKFMLSDPMNSAKVLGIERAHFKSTLVARNNRARDKQEVIRRGQSHTTGHRLQRQAPTAPHTLEGMPHNTGNIDAEVEAAIRMQHHLEQEERDASAAPPDNGPLAELDLDNPGKAKPKPD